MGKQWKQCQTLFFGADGDCSHDIKRRLLLGRKVMTNLDSIFKSRDYFANKGLSSQGYGFSSGHVWMWELDCEESWAPKNWCFWTVVLEKTLASPLDCEEIQAVHPKGNQSWVFIERTDAEAEIPVLWPPHAKSWLIGKDLDTGRDWGQEEKGTTEDEMAGWHHRPQWAWIWVNSGSWWWTGRPGVLRFMGPQRVRQDWTTELNWDKKFLASWTIYKVIYPFLNCWKQCGLFQHFLLYCSYLNL